MPSNPSAVGPKCQHSAIRHLSYNVFCSQNNAIVKVVAGIFIALAGVGACVYFYQRFLANKTVKKISPSAPSMTTSSTSQTTTQVTVTTPATTNSSTVTTTTKPKEPERPYKELLPMRDYPEAGKEALKTVRGLDVSQVSDKAIFTWSQYQPTNPEIPRLHALLYDVYLPKLLETAKIHKDQPIVKDDGTDSGNFTLKWNAKEMTEIANTCIQLSYAISCLTLEDLEPFTKSQSEKPTPSHVLKHLVEQQGWWQFRTFFICPKIYLLIRGACGIAGLFHLNFLDS
jgi:hypothetical protein